MGWIGKSMLDFKEKSVKLYPVPKRVQELIPVHRISEDGNFELEKKPEDAEKLEQELQNAGIPARIVGTITEPGEVEIFVRG